MKAKLKPADEGLIIMFNFIYRRRFFLEITQPDLIFAISSTALVLAFLGDKVGDLIGV